MNRSKIAAIVAYILTTAAILLCGCSQQPQDTVANTKPDISRTAVLFSSLAEMWVDAGGDIYATVGETVERGIAPEGTLLVDDGAGKTVNMELLISYKPTLVICSADIPAQLECAVILEKSGIKTVALHVESFEDYASAFKIMTTLTGNDDAYEKHVVSQRNIIGELIRNSVKGKSVLFIRAGSSASSTKAKLPEDHFAAEMLSELGCRNIAEDAPLLIDGLSTEAILTEDPDFIFFSLMGNEEAARSNIEAILKSDGWSSLSAVREGRVVILPKELFHFKPCSRWHEAYEYLADNLTEVSE